jgi:hypothetical protein
VSEVTVYRFRVYDITTDENRASRRWATRDAIERVRGEVLEETATAVDPSVVGGEIHGMTERNFDPHRNIGIQTQVRNFNPFRTTNAAGSFRVSSFEEATTGVHNDPSADLR